MSTPKRTSNHVRSDMATFDGLTALVAGGASGIGLSAVAGLRLRPLSGQS
jgi:hypothetical protein